ncbi:hypothetical protein QWY93_18155 [Echinicola jeungdonensis]|uniref:hypothetical protein n=1 Tax=Echinicola jeungdonensis TaxID=709343 RepID=UPI0025B41795|nr:hypothetical protein [Echinicola jeungdonensis]MDN3671230.1 hypothetical protein [Echinicola jeungdonensis]
MDQPLTGLDVETRRHFNEVLDAIVASGIQVIMTTSPEEIPDAITHVAIIENGKILEAVEKTAFHPSDLVHHAALSQFDHQKLDAFIEKKPIEMYQELVKMNQIHIQYNGNVILDKVNWEIKQGECWVLRAIMELESLPC